MSTYDTERVNKISQIMPQFAKVANEGDTVLMGLEGDPLFPFTQKNRPTAVISNIEHRKHDSIITLKLNDGTTKDVSSSTLASDQVWEFDDKSFQNVMDRQRKEMEARAEQEIKVEQPPFRGVDESIITELKSEIESLKNQLNSTNENNKNFHNTMIASMNEMASDICRLDTSGKNTEFCRTLKSEYGKLLESRAEQPISTSEIDDFSADDTDFF